MNLAKRWSAPGPNAHAAGTAGRCAPALHRLTLLLLTAGLAGCATHTPKPAVQPPTIAALPIRASFAWVRPSAVIGDATSADDESAGTGAAHTLRTDIETLLMGQGWSMVAAERADFVASIAFVQRTTMRSEVRSSPDGIPREVCDRTRTPPQCRTVIEPRTYTVQVPVSETRAVLAMRRRSDGAWRQWTTLYAGTQSSSDQFLKELIRILELPARR